MRKKISAFLTLGLLAGLSGRAWADFPDTKGHQFETAINYVHAEQIVQGYPDTGLYLPDELINRAEFTKIIVEARFSQDEIDNCNESVFPDVVPEEHWFAPYVCLAEKNDIVKGYDDGTFRPKDDIMISEAAKIITLGFGYDLAEGTPWHLNYMTALEDAYALPVTLTGFKHRVTRGEMAAIIYRLDAAITDQASTYYEYLSILDEINRSYINYSDAEAYNEGVVMIYNHALDSFNSYIERSNETLLEVSELEILDLERIETIAFLGHLKEIAMAIDGFKEDMSLINALIDEVNVWIDLLENEYKQLIQLWISMTDEADGMGGGNDIELKLIQGINQKRNAADNSSTAIQIKFAQNHGLETENLETGAAIQYHDQVVDLYNQAFDAQVEYDEMVNDTDLGEDFGPLEDKRKATIAAVESLRSALNELGGFDGDDSLKKAAEGYFEAVIDTMKNEELALIELWQEAGNQDMSEAEIDAQNELAEAIIQEHKEAYEVFTNEQIDFSNRYGFELVFS